MLIIIHILSREKRGEARSKPRKPAQRPAVQERSRESLRRMLDAAEAVVAKHGLEGAILPRIAAKAGISAANVYRRFRDKDALIAAVFQRIRERSSAATASQVDPEKVRPIGLARFSRNIIGGMIQNYRGGCRFDSCGRPILRATLGDCIRARHEGVRGAIVSDDGGHLHDLARSD